MGLMHQSSAARLERSCDWVRHAPACVGLERVEAHFCGHRFDPHRHDTYAVGFTIRGVQSFRYRGAARHSVAGQIFVLHPDEVHDGRAGTRASFHYRIAYVAPSAIHAALGEAGPLPFVRDVVSNNEGLARAIVPALDDLDCALDDMRRDQIATDIADALAGADVSRAPKPAPARHARAVAIARELLDGSVANGLNSTELEAATGLSRYDLSRQFRACLGTSPYRYLVMRRLDRARELIRKRVSLAEAALACGFADQSHLTRHFKKAYGVSPGRWAALTAN
jgi:AraC-like DNA-binding protein